VISIILTIFPSLVLENTVRTTKSNKIIAILSTLKLTKTLKAHLDKY